MSMTSDDVIRAVSQHWQSEQHPAVCACCGNAWPCITVRLADALNRERMANLYTRALLRAAERDNQQLATALVGPQS